jgi:hypothetical protein
MTMSMKNTADAKKKKREEEKKERKNRNTDVFRSSIYLYRLDHENPIP